MRVGRPGVTNTRINRGCEIARILWPAIELTVEGDFWDKYGQDAHLYGKTVQVKYDKSIIKYHNIYNSKAPRVAETPGAG